MKTSAALLFLALCFFAAPSHAEKAPAAANLLDVTLPEFGAIPDDGLDDYPAIKIAMGFQDGFTGNTLYFPCGTYNFHETVEWRDWPTIIHPNVQVSVFSVQGTPPNQISGYLWTIGMPWQGEDRDCVTIKLDDNSPGFGDPNTPKSFIMPGSLVGPSSNQKGLTGGNGGAGAYQNWFEDLTIDCGSGNPGVRCIDWIANNAGELRRVRVKSGDGQGFAGIYMGRGWPGPCIILDTIVEGFNYGIYLLQSQYSVTFFRNTLRNQHIAGFYLSANVATMEKMTIEEDTDIPAVIQADGGSQLGILNSHFTGPEGATHSAIEVNAGAKFFLENVETENYASALKVGTTVREAGPNITQAVSRVPFKLFNAPDKVLDIPIQEPPDPYFSDPDTYPEEWANVIDYGAGPGYGGETNNDVAAIQAAMNSGKPIIYFPKQPERVGRPAGFDSTYAYKGPTITVPGTVRRVFFYRNSGSILASAYPTDQDCIFTVVGEATDPPVEFNYWRRSTVLTGARTFCNKSNGRTMVVRSSPNGLSILTDRENTTFLIDTISHVDASNGAKVFAWQYNQEAFPVIGQVVIGATYSNPGTEVRIIGMKTEGDHVAARITDGAKYKMIGGFYFPCIGRNLVNPILSDGFQIVNAQASLSFIQYCGKNPSSPLFVWPNAILQTIESTTRALRSDQTIFTASCCSNRNYLPLFNAIPSDARYFAANIQDGPGVVTLPYGVGAREYQLVQTDTSGVNGVNMDPGTWTQPVSCIGMNHATMRVDLPSEGTADFDLYTCQQIPGGSVVGEFDPASISLPNVQRSCRNLSGDVTLNGVPPNDVLEYEGSLSMMMARLNRCTGDCRANVTLECTR